MKIITLNTWGGRISQIDNFIKSYAPTTDIFCFQEVHAKKTKEADISQGERPEFFEELEILLPNFVGIFAQQISQTGLAIFIRDNFKIENTNSYILLSADEIPPPQSYPRIVQTVTLENPHITIFNFHGIPGKEKKDTPQREKQMDRLHKILSAYGTEKILLGDFNLCPETKAIHGIEQIMRNLVAENRIKTTRTKLYKKKEIMPFADYIFITPGITVNEFKVLQEEVSDHLPLLLDFNI